MSAGAGDRIAFDPVAVSQRTEPAGPRRAAAGRTRPPARRPGADGQDRHPDRRRPGRGGLPSAAQGTAGRAAQRPGCQPGQEHAPAAAARRGPEPEPRPGAVRLRADSGPTMAAFGGRDRQRAALRPSTPLQPPSTCSWPTKERTPLLFKALTTTAPAGLPVAGLEECTAGHPRANEPDGRSNPRDSELVAGQRNLRGA